MEDERGLILEGKGKLVVGTRMKGQQTRNRRVDKQEHGSLTTDDGGRGRKQGWMVQAEVGYMPQDLTATPGNS